MSESGRDEQREVDRWLATYIAANHMEWSVVDGFCALESLVMHRIATVCVCINGSFDWGLQKG